MNKKEINFLFSGLQIVFDGDFVVWQLKNKAAPTFCRIVVANWKNREIVHIFSLNKIFLQVTGDEFLYLSRCELHIKIDINYIIQNFHYSFHLDLLFKMV